MAFLEPRHNGSQIFTYCKENFNANIKDQIAFYSILDWMLVTWPVNKYKTTKTVH